HFAAAPINHVLRGESWALRRLAPFSSRTARFDVLPFSATFTVSESGELGPAAPDATPDVHFRLTPPVAARILAGDAAAYDEVSVQGYAEFAQSIQFVVRNASWDV